ncbi:hypothetical protein CEXT_26071 [Caerostris extrusa]|uniref:Uncharacterized protein n=1 Tax=Caerostris extrusa TaxID=172846 RepID=A0AAV4YDT3_CAEEX|nr:hypothetical protein CEXT_26071 [Caerostris extrusa]
MVMDTIMDMGMVTNMNISPREANLVMESKFQQLDTMILEQFTAMDWILELDMDTHYTKQKPVDLKNPLLISRPKLSMSLCLSSEDTITSLCLDCLNLNSLLLAENII